jgi:hypothetical protein
MSPLLGFIGGLTSKMNSKQFRGYFYLLSILIVGVGGNI